MASYRQGNVILGINAHVIALNPTSGEELWRTKLKPRAKMSDIVTLRIEDDAIYAGNSGEIFCLDPMTGELRWQNGLKGLGTGLVSFATPAEAAAEIQRRQRAAASHGA